MDDDSGTYGVIQMSLCLCVSVFHFSTSDVMSRMQQHICDGRMALLSVGGTGT